MKKVDFIFQSIFILAALICLPGGGDFLVVIAAIQFVVGIWQLVSALSCTVNREKKDTFRKVHLRRYWISVLLYFMILLILSYTAEDYALGWFFSAWLIAAYYYVFTFRLAFRNTSNSRSFLDVVG